ncbi:hypothetical protein B0T16DRAFT_146082 [Cercophora newfieldiana]|uniref:Uncharacterized protein n=1 Tax=Cercophora newfieldiana TaxID=92897 RepID=A0AA39Y483_9PEZI|nr:hypothetical protein B0T16DRAFT_146082 [Cercophora newfieldiana]
MELFFFTCCPTHKKLLQSQRGVVLECRDEKSEGARAPSPKAAARLLQPVRKGGSLTIGTVRIVPMMTRITVRKSQFAVQVPTPSSKGKLHRRPVPPSPDAARFRSLPLIAPPSSPLREKRGAASGCSEVPPPTGLRTSRPSSRRHPGAEAPLPLSHTLRCSLPPLLSVLCTLPSPLPTAQLLRPPSGPLPQCPPPFALFPSPLCFATPTGTVRESKMRRTSLSRSPAAMRRKKSRCDASSVLSGACWRKIRK